MQPNDLAKLLGVTANTVRRWTNEYFKFLTPQASPPAGEPRVYVLHDQRIFHFIAAARAARMPLTTIRARLEAMQGQDWQGLPDIPPDWRDAAETMPIALAASKAYDLAQLAVIQKELEHTQQALQQATERAEALQTALDSARSTIDTSAGKLHALELELSQARGDVSELKARLDSYALAYGMGRDKPLPLALVIAITAVAAVLIVLLVFIVARVLL